MLFRISLLKTYNSNRVSFIIHRYSHVSFNLFFLQWHFIFDFTSHQRRTSNIQESCKWVMVKGERGEGVKLLNSVQIWAHSYGSGGKMKLLFAAEWKRVPIRTLNLGCSTACLWGLFVKYTHYY